MPTPSAVPPTVHAQLSHATRILADAGLPAPYDDALALLSRVLGVSTAVLLTAAEQRMSPSALAQYAEWVGLRVTGVAIPHITGFLEFMGLEFQVGREDRLPGPGAQGLVETGLRWARQRATGGVSAAEIGTGCGAIALALATLEPRFSRIHAVDASAAAQETASANGARYLLNLVVQWLPGDGLESVTEPVDLIVRDGFAEDAKDMRLIWQATTGMRPGGAFICTVDNARRHVVRDLLAHAFPSASIYLEPARGGSVVLIAQLPRSSDGPTGAAGVSSQEGTL